MARIIFGIILIAIGLSALTGLSLFKFVISVIIIAIGIRVITGKGRDWNWENTVSNENSINEVAIFSPLNKTIKSENFNGGKIVMIFAGGDIDISQVKAVEKNISMEIVAVFGGGKLIIPKDWRVNSEGVAIFGGYNSKITQGAGETTLNIKGAAIFGGMEIINK